MKKTNFLKIMSLALLFVIGLITSCSDDSSTPATSPTIEADSPIDANAGTEITFTGTLSDDAGIKSLTIVNEELGLNANLTTNDNPTTIPIEYSFTIPAATAEGSYDVVLTVTNISDLTSNTTVVVNVSVPVARALYIAGGIQWWAWDPGHAYEFAPDADDFGWYETILPSWPAYDDGAGNISRYDEFKILGQLDWGPDNWGLNASGAVINDESSIAFDLPPMDLNPAYYTVRFNLETLATEFTHLEDNTTARTDMSIVIDGVETALGANFYSYGEHLFGAESVVLDDEVEISFSGSGDYTVGFENGGARNEPISWTNMVVDGGASMTLSGQAGNYTILYDDFAKKAVIWKE
ncbi:MAG: DUF4625 domain-containing protein [Reichenbachiella sp.]